MMRLACRRIVGIGLLAVFTALFWLLNFALNVSLRDAAIVSGLTLLVLVLTLAFFNPRKKLPFLPLLKASTWMQIHIYAGLFSIVLFLIHTGWKQPRGGLEIVLAILFWAVALSGVLGLILSRVAPVRLTLHGENLLFERIPALRDTIRKDVQELVLNSVAEARSSTIADFYEQELRGYFAAGRNYWSHLIGSRRPLQRLLAELEALDRYLNEEERKVMAEVADYVRAKDNLDFQFALQGALKLWLFAHIPLTSALILFAIAHGLLAWRFAA